MGNNYFTRQNMKNWKWWVALSLLVLTIIALSPIIIIAIVIDALEGAISYVESLITRAIDKLDRVMSKLWAKVGKWVKS